MTTSEPESSGSGLRPDPGIPSAPVECEGQAEARPSSFAHSILDEAAPREPRSPGELFRVFNRLALQGFGGVLPIAQHELVEHQGWLTREQFVELLSIAQVLPGPNVVNLALMFGDRHFGWRGGLAALGGMILAPLGLVLVLAAVYTHFAQHPVVAGALRGMGAVAAGLVLSTGLKLLPALHRNTLGLVPALALAALTFGAIAIARVPMLWVLVALGGIACAWAWRRLRP